MKKTILKSIALFLSIPILNSITFGIGTQFHDMHQSVITQEQFATYQFAMLAMIGVIGVSILAIETLFDGQLISNKTANWMYLGVFTFLAIVTYDQFLFRPYEHTLTFTCALSILASRHLPEFNFRIKQLSNFNNA